jgi:predicted alpha/beta hydrolase family esterase
VTLQVKTSYVARWSALSTVPSSQPATPSHQKAHWQQQQQLQQQSAPLPPGLQQALATLQRPVWLQQSPVVVVGHLAVPLLLHMAVAGVVLRLLLLLPLLLLLGALTVS